MVEDREQMTGRSRRRCQEALVDTIVKPDFGRPPGALERIAVGRASA